MSISLLLHVTIQKSRKSKIFEFARIRKTSFPSEIANCVQIPTLVYVYIRMKKTLCTFYQSLWSPLLTFPSPKSDNCSIFRLQVCLGVSPWYFYSLSYENPFKYCPPMLASDLMVAANQLS